MALCLPPVAAAQGRPGSTQVRRPCPRPCTGHSWKAQCKCPNPCSLKTWALVPSSANLQQHLSGLPGMYYTYGKLVLALRAHHRTTWGLVNAPPPGLLIQQVRGQLRELTLFEKFWMLPVQRPQHQRYPETWFKNHSINITWKCVRNANFRAP